jgi:hypothetical protein
MGPESLAMVLATASERKDGPGRCGPSKVMHTGESTDATRVHQDRGCTDLTHRLAFTRIPPLTHCPLPPNSDSVQTTALDGVDQPTLAE